MPEVTVSYVNVCHTTTVKGLNWFHPQQTLLFIPEHWPSWWWELQTSSAAAPDSYNDDAGESMPCTLWVTATEENKEYQDNQYPQGRTECPLPPHSRRLFHPMCQQCRLKHSKSAEERGWLLWEFKGRTWLLLVVATFEENRAGIHFSRVYLDIDDQSEFAIIICRGEASMRWKECKKFNL